MAVFSLFITLQTDLSADIFQHGIRDMIAAALSPLAEVVDFYSSQDNDPDARNRLYDAVVQHLSQHHPRAMYPAPE